MMSSAYLERGRGIGLGGRVVLERKLKIWGIAIMTMGYN
jgi:hypothetical protein